MRAQHISTLKRAVQDEPDGFLDVDSQPPLTKLLKADEKQFGKASPSCYTRPANFTRGLIPALPGGGTLGC